MTLQPGQNLAHYRLVEKIGEGGMGVVWKAMDTTLDREVALKFLPDSIAGQPDRLARFQREAKLLAALNHPYIASVYGLHEIDGQRFLAMEMIEGEDLSQRLKKGPLPAEEALQAARQIAEGLETAHESGIIHRDLKPANIKLSKAGGVKILDFGLGKALEDRVEQGNATMSPTLTAAATQAGMIMGTAAYMSPEQARGQDADRRADIWSFGVVLFEMLGGVGLFDDGTISDTLASVLKSEPDWNALPIGTSPRIRRLLQRCLRKDARRRLRDIGDARILIEEVLEGGDESDASAMTEGATAAASMRAAAPQSVWRRALPWGISIVLLVSLIVTTTVLIRELAPAPVTRFSQTFTAESRMSLQNYPAVAISPDGRMLAFVVGSAVSSEIWLRDLDSLETRMLPGTEGAGNPVFSPDGKWVAFFTGGAIRKIAVAGGGAMRLAESSNNPRGLSWGEPDRLIYSPITSTGLSQVPGSGGIVQEIIATDSTKGERTFRWPQILPGGKAVIFTVGSTESPEYYDDSPIQALDLETGERKTLIQGASMARYVTSGHLVYARGGSLFAVPFDADRLEVLGSPVPVLEGVLTNRNSGAVQFDVSLNGTLVYVPGTERRALRKLIWIDREGNVEDIPAPHRSYIQPIISPDGKRIAVVDLGDKTQDIWMYDIRRQVMNRFTFQGNNLNPVWAPDGSEIFYASSDLSVGTDDYKGLRILRKPSDGSGRPELVAEDEVQLIPNSIARDGHTLIVDRLSGPAASDLYFKPLEPEGDMEPFLTSSFDEWMGSFSPDGQWIAYTSNESGQLEVYVRPVTEASGKWQISIGGGTEPQWSQDRKELFYLNGNKMMKVDIETTGGFQPGTPELLFETTKAGDSGATTFYDVTYTVSPDGQRFLMLQPTDDSEEIPVAAVVLNWTTELLEKVPIP